MPRRTRDRLRRQPPALGDGGLDSAHRDPVARPGRVSECRRRAADRRAFRGPGGRAGDRLERARPFAAVRPGRPRRARPVRRAARRRPAGSAPARSREARLFARAGAARGACRCPTRPASRSSRVATAARRGRALGLNVCDADFAIVLVAAGASTRMGFPKLWADVARSAAARSRARRRAAPPTRPSWFVVVALDRVGEAACAGARRARVVRWRRAPPRLGRRRAWPRPRPAWLAIHDAARALAPPELFHRGLDAAQPTGAAVPGVPLKDTIKRVADARVIDTPCARRARRRADAANLPSRRPRRGRWR